MSCLFVQPDHFWLSLIGYKWETRRLWDTQRVTAGKSYRLLRAGIDDMLTPRSEAPAFAIARDVHTELLGAINERAARAEGQYTVDEFIEEWRRINGKWTPEREVYVVTYDATLEDPRGETPGEQAELAV